MYVYKIMLEVYLFQYTKVLTLSIYMYICNIYVRKSVFMYIDLSWADVGWVTSKGAVFATKVVAANTW